MVGLAEEPIDPVEEKTMLEKDQRETLQFD